jgi:hypothetical protein
MVLCCSLQVFALTDAELIEIRDGFDARRDTILVIDVVNRDLPKFLSGLTYFSN